MPAATAAAEPLEEPPGVCAALCGLRVLPEAPLANSVVTVLPMMTAPAPRSSATTLASRDGVRPACSGDPFSVGMSAVSTMSLIPTGTPCNGPSGCPSRFHWSAARACPSACSGSRNAQACTSPSTSRTRARHASTHCSDEITFSRISRAPSTTETAYRLARSMPRSLAGFVVLCNRPKGLPVPGGRRSAPPVLRFVLSRSGQTVAVLFMASVIIFAIMRLIPGDPVLMMLGDDFTQTAYEQMRAKLGLDRSIVVQYVLWLGNVLRGDLGDSLLQHERVSILVWDAFVPTLVLVVASLIAGMLIAVPSGIVAAMRKDSAWDYGSMGFAIFVYSMPAFWKGIILIWIFSVYLGWFPAMGYVAPWKDLSDALWKLVLPAITLGTFFSGLVARIIRSSLLEVLGADYIKAARAKGVRQAALVYRHALSNALIPVMTVIGLQFGALLGGAVLTETVFAIPGMGRLTVSAILNRDYAVVQGTILAGVLLVVIVNLAVDLTYAFLNPKIRVA